MGEGGHGRADLDDRTLGRLRRAYAASPPNARRDAAAERFSLAPPKAAAGGGGGEDGDTPYTY